LPQGGGIQDSDSSDADEDMANLEGNDLVEAEAAIENAAAADDDDNDEDHDGNYEEDVGLGGPVLANAEGNEGAEGGADGEANENGGEGFNGGEENNGG